MFSNVYGPPITIFDRLPPEPKELALAVYRKNLGLKPLNLRVLDGADLNSITIKRSDEGTEGYELQD